MKDPGAFGGLRVREATSVFPLASPRRRDPANGKNYSLRSLLKAIGDLDPFIRQSRHFQSRKPADRPQEFIENLRASPITDANSIGRFHLPGKAIVKRHQDPARQRPLGLHPSPPFPQGTLHLIEDEQRFPHRGTQKGGSTHNRSPPGYLVWSTWQSRHSMCPCWWFMPSL
jgi:hypothetical protein